MSTRGVMPRTDETHMVLFMMMVPSLDHYVVLVYNIRPSELRSGYPSAASLWRAEEAVDTRTESDLDRCGYG